MEKHQINDNFAESSNEGEAVKRSRKELRKEWKTEQETKLQLKINQI
jgi:hypothetical protein